MNASTPSSRSYDGSARRYSLRGVVRPPLRAGRRGCDVCRSPVRRVLHDQRFVTFDHDAGLLAGYDVVTCGVCGFVYADGLPEQAVFERYYREMSKHEPDWDATRPAPAYIRHNTDLVALQVAERLPDRAARILDVGVGSGETLFALRELGYTDLTGLDPSPRTGEVVRREHQLRVLTTPVSQMGSCTERYDVILLSGVLEHLRDLHPTLMLLKSLLSANGRMCIAVPDATRFAESVESPFQYLSVEHINFFTAVSLESLFAGVGMDLERCWEATALLGVFKEPIIQGIFGLRESALPFMPDPAMRDPDGASEMARYVVASRRLQDSLTSGLGALVGADEGIIVWGAGSLTMHLLTDRVFSELHIVAFVDANVNYWGKTIRGVPVISPARVKDYEETILIVSYAYEDEICSQIRDQYKLHHKVVRLFGESRGETATNGSQMQYG